MLGRHGLSYLGVVLQNGLVVDADFSVGIADFGKVLAHLFGLYHSVAVDYAALADDRFLVGDVHEVNAWRSA